VNAALATVAVVIALSVAQPSPVPSVDLEKEARTIDVMLIAPCCFTQQVSIHRSEASAGVQRDVRARLAAGQTRQQILDAYVAHYGKRILAEPPASGFGLILYITPLVLFIGSVGLVVVIARRLTRGALAGASASADARTAAAMSLAENARLDDELRDLD
jgi:cytochrome c-type biogenesis protein CcmH